MMSESEEPMEPMQRLPGWPRLLTRELAAAYCGLSPIAFKRHVRIKPMRIGSNTRWDRAAIDVWLDFKNGIDSLKRELQAEDWERRKAAHEARVAARGY